MSSTETVVAPEAPVLRGFFDAIAFRYDFLNTFLSFKLDDFWRRKSRDLILTGGESSILDLGVGTGKFLELFLRGRKWRRACGLDFSSKMLAGCRQVVSQPVQLVNGDFQALPFLPGSFDCVISAFALRSVRQMDGFLKGVFDLLTARGKVGFLCLTRPQNFFWKIIYYPYLKFYLPVMGGILTGNKKAYHFLSDSILSFQDPENTSAMMLKIGFREVKIHRFTGGAATLIVGTK